MMKNQNRYVAKATKGLIRKGLRGARKELIQKPQTAIRSEFMTKPKRAILHRLDGYLYPDAEAINQDPEEEKLQEEREQSEYDEAELAFQSGPNVLFEAGLAYFGRSSYRCLSAPSPARLSTTSV